MTMTEYTIVFTTIFSIGTIATLCALAYVIERWFIAAKLRRLRKELEVELYEAEVMGEGEQIFNLLNYYLEQPFTYARTALYMLMVLVPVMHRLNVWGYQEFNFIFSAFILVLAIMMAMRWPVVLTVMGLGALENLLQSTEEKPEDVSKGTIEGLQYFVKAICSVIMLVWILSVVLSVIPWGTSPKSFWLVLLGFSGFYLYTGLRGYPRLKWAVDYPIMGLFLYVAFVGIATILGYSPRAVYDGIRALFEHNAIYMSALGIIPMMLLAGFALIYLGRKA